MTERRELQGRARAMRREPTLAEQRLWGLLRGGRLDGLKFRRQVPLGDFIADFACFYPKVIVECDGGQHADSAYDAARDAWFRAQGFRVLRYWNNEVVDHPNETAEAILRALGRGP
jgi:very-short-patch-repair endonuclease